MRLCLYSGIDGLFPAGRILRNLGDYLAAAGHDIRWMDEYNAPDAYIVEAVMPKRLRWDRPIILHAENLIGRGARESHAWDSGAAIVFNSAWLRRLYRNTYGDELRRAVVIPPAFDARDAGPRRVSDPISADEVVIACASKWWKRPYKRLPLHVKAVEILRTDFGWKQARLHIFGWEPTMPYYHTPPYYWRGMNMRGVRIHQRSFYRMTWPDLLSQTHILLHASAIDSGPQVVMEALSRGIPSVISNNMGAAEWLRDVGQSAGRVVETDNISENYASVSKIADWRFEGRGWITQALLHPLRSIAFSRLCSRVAGAEQLAAAMDDILRNYAEHQFIPPRKYTMEGVADAWVTLIRNIL